MAFTDTFVRRPVLSLVISLFVLVLGLRSMGLLPVMEFPQTENAVVTVTTAYPGADPDLVSSFITSPLENSIAQANGIDYLTSSSTPGLSTITANLILNYDADKALTEINTKVNAVLNQLPAGAQHPVLTISIGQTIDAMYIGFSSTVLTPNKITDYLTRVVQPQLQAVAGVQTAEIIGQQLFALRVWLDPTKLAEYGLSADEVSQALANNNFLSALGNTKGDMVQINLTASTGLHSVDEFRNLILKESNGAIIRLKDVARVTLGSQNYESAVAFDGKRAVYIGIQIAPDANLLDVISRVRTAFSGIQDRLPQGLNGQIVYDSTRFVDSSITDVEHTLVEALLIVTLVVFAFLGSIRSVIIPVIAIPLSLIGTFLFMLLFHYSINLLTLLALVLAIGLVVDDAIIVVENVNRHLEEGLSPQDAAITAARELGGPIIAMTVVLIAVYIPIGFMGGLTGALFTEFAFTLVGAVTISALIALTLSPMMCSRFLHAHRGGGERLSAYLDERFDRLHRRYQALLHDTLNYIPVTVTFAVTVLGSLYFLYTTASSELAPQEDQGVIIAFATGAPDSTLAARELYSHQVEKIFTSHPETAHVFQLDVPGRMVAGMVLKPWDERTKTATELQQPVQMALSQVAGLKIAAFQPPPLPGGVGFPVQFVLKSTSPFSDMDTIANHFLAAVQHSGLFIFVDDDLKYDMPQTQITIDRSLASELGLDMASIGRSLSTLLGGNYVNYFSLAGRSYQVIPQVDQRFRLTTDQLNSYYLTTATGAEVPLSTIARLKTVAVPESLNHFQQQNSVTISGVPFPGVTQGAALTYLQGLAKKMLPPGYSVDYGGQSRQYMQESSAFLTTFFFALVIIFLALAAQFESFRDPIIILVSVPMSVCGALIFINLGLHGTSLNIYTEVGLVTLIGLISKHGILIVEFANNLQAAGAPKRDAIEEAAAIRLRPILMTTAAMVFGVIPLLTATGAGAVSRFNMGIVIGSGIAIGTLFTLFVVPAMYMLLATDHQHSH